MEANLKQTLNQQHQQQVNDTQTVMTDRHTETLDCNATLNHRGTTRQHVAISSIDLSTLLMK